MSLDAFVVDGGDRERLAQKFPPKFPDFIGHHITHRFGIRPNDSYGEQMVVHLVGYACNDTGLEAFVVSVNGNTTRPDGKTYHLTWSLDRTKGFKPVDSGDLVRGKWQSIDPPIPIITTYQHL